MMASSMPKCHFLYCWHPPGIVLASAGIIFVSPQHQFAILLTFDIGITPQAFLGIIPVFWHRKVLALFWDHFDSSLAPLWHRLPHQDFLYAHPYDHVWVSGVRWTNCSKVGGATEFWTVDNRSMLAFTHSHPISDCQCLGGQSINRCQKYASSNFSM